MRMFLSLAATLLALTACAKRKEAPAPPAAPQAQTGPLQVSGAWDFGTILETFDAANYTYVRVKTSSGEIWAAATPFKATVGSKVAIPTDMAMENFYSPTLKRTFPLIYFTSKVIVKGEPGFPPEA